MRTFQMSLIACMLIFAVPAVAADDPTYEIPDATEVFQSGAEFGASAAGAAEGMADTAMTNAEDAKDDGQNQTLPASRAAAVAGGAATFGTTMIGAAGTLAGAVEGWALERAENKRDEAFASVDALLGVGVAAIGAGDQVAGAAVGVVCGDQLVNDLAGDECGDASLVNVARDQARGFGNETATQASSDRTSAMVAAIESFVGNIVGLPDN